MVDALRSSTRRRVSRRRRQSIDKGGGDFNCLYVRETELSSATRLHYAAGDLPRHQPTLLVTEDNGWTESLTADNMDIAGGDADEAQADVVGEVHPVHCSCLPFPRVALSPTSRALHRFFGTLCGWVISILTGTQLKFSTHKIVALLPMILSNNLSAVQLAGFKAILLMRLCSVYANGVGLEYSRLPIQKILPIGELVMLMFAPSRLRETSILVVYNTCDPLRHTNSALNKRFSEGSLYKCTKNWGARANCSTHVYLRECAKTSI